MEYSACRQAISKALSKTGTEHVPLQNGFARITAKDLFAKVPQPEFTQSLRDGYVVSDTAGNDKTVSSYSLSGIIQAGNTTPYTLKSGEACRIMTGGMIPNGGARVFAQEDCTVSDDILQVSPEVRDRSATYIQQSGSRIAIDEKILSAGSVLTPDFLSVLAAVGHQHIEVYRKPKVGYFCTGSELVDSAEELQPGLKISSNRYLLEGSIRQSGGEPVYLGTIADSTNELGRVFTQIIDSDLDIVISTGGMGPGKYDLIEQCFRECSGEVIYNRLNLIPGKNSLFGVLAKSLFWGLPGPPNAVRALMNSIVCPAILEMQGATEVYPQRMQAELSHNLTRNRAGLMQLTAASLYFENGKCLVKATRNHEQVNCYIVVPSDQLFLAEGNIVTLQLVSSPL